ncbi:MAG TPA: S46 family peptidase [Caulobacteraceae bacterium]|nr:S46 family peptidase [Caulobacteraceae bacterium]
MKPISVAAAFALAAVSAGAARADEGLWTFDAFPAAKVKAALGVTIDQAWLDKVRLASARLSVGCSSSIVSGQGLLLTNHHCAADCAQSLSPPGQDYTRTGFIETSLAEERTCPGLVADILLETTDVTARMLAAGKGFSGEALVKARAAAASAMTQQVCGADPKLHCEVVSLYQGGQFKLYRYRRYDDVRLAFDPGDPAAFFGGDPDNFNFPRYALDCAFLRLYEGGKPVVTPQRLVWNPAPPTAGEPTFVAGDPGGTFREQTIAQIEFQRDVSLPVELAELSELRGRLIRFTEEDPANARAADEPLNDVENAFKVTVGRLAALDDPEFMAARRAAEADLRARTRLPPGVDPWRDMAAAQKARARLFVAWRQLERGADSSQLFGYARDLVRGGLERGKPSADRLPRYADSELPGVEKALLDPDPIVPALEQLVLEFWLSKSRELLTADDPDTKLLLGAESPEQLSRRLVSATRLGDAGVRKALWDGGWKAIQASDDSLIRFMVEIDPEARRARAAFEDQVTGPEARASEAIARLRLAAYGQSLYPDGTFTLRLSYGRVAGWTWRAQTVGPFTTFAGLYGRATGQPPFDLDPRWIAARHKLNPDTIFNFVTDNDIIGGNSGSPVLNAKAEVIGVAFDGNILSIGGDYGWDGRVNRSVALTTAAMTEALTKVYGANALVRELTDK